MFLLLLHSIGMKGQDTTALDYFNRASREYVKVDKLTALRTLDAGLRQFPGDPRMLRLAEELLKEDQQQQQDQKKKDQEKKDQEKQEQDQQQKEKGEEKQPDQQDGEKKKDQEQKPGEQQDPQQQREGQEQRKPGSIAPQDARRMLDALDREEKEVQDKVRVRQRPASRVPIEKDW